MSKRLLVHNVGVQQTQQGIQLHGAVKDRGPRDEDHPLCSWGHSNQRLRPGHPVVTKTRYKNKRVPKGPLRIQENVRSFKYSVRINMFGPAQQLGAPESCS